MNATVSTPAAVVIPAQPRTTYARSLDVLKARADRVENARAMAKEMSLPALTNFPGDHELRKIERAYAQYQAELNAWLDEREAEIAARADEHADEMGRVERFA